MAVAKDERRHTPAADRCLDTGTGAAPRRIVLAAITLGSLAAGFAVTSPSAALQASAADPGLTLLLQAMSLLKALAAALLVAGILWRLSAPISLRWLSVYLAAAALTAAGIGPMWHIAHLMFGATLLHCGLIAGAVLLWRDPAVSRMLDERLRRLKENRR